MAHFYDKTLVLGLCIILGCLLACTSEKKESKRDIRAYYYPLAKIEKQGIVYAYDALNAKEGITNTEYWYVQMLKTDTGDYVVSTYYDPTLTQGLNSIDRVVDNGTVLTHITFYETDKETGKRIPIEGHIDSGNSFPFLVSDSTGVFVYSVKYQPVGHPDTWNYIIRNKRFYGDGPDFSFKGNALPTLQFLSKEVVGSDSEGAAELEGKVEQRYAKGLGLVYYKKSYKGFNQEYALADTFNMDKLIEQARAQAILQGSK